MTSGNPILDKNLECIARYNDELVNKLLKMPCLMNQFELVETNLKEPNLLFNGIPLHSPEGAELEAKSAFEQVKNTPTSRHIVFGLGIGHLFKECCERSKGLVLLYEPDLEILRVTFELVDFSKELSQENVFITSDVKFLKYVFKQTYLYGCNPSFLALGSYRGVLYHNQIAEIIEDFQIMVGSCKENFQLSKFEEERSVLTVLNNIQPLLNSTPLYEYKDVYKGKTALVVSAGPTLDSNIEIMKKYRDKVVIFCVGTAFRALATNGITPDFVNLIEINDASGQLKGFDLSNINIITEAYTNNSIFQLKVKQRFLYPSALSYANRFWASVADFDVSPYFVKGTVSYAALASAKMMGCSKLILVGQDLAYVNNQCYSNGSAYSDLIYEVNPDTKKIEFRIKDEERYIEANSSVDPNKSQADIEKFAQNRVSFSEKTLCTVKGINGEMIPSNVSLVLFVQDFEEFTFMHKDLELINTSMVGAQINGFKNMPLEEALIGSSVVDRITDFKPIKYDIKGVIERLNQSNQRLKDALKMCSTSKTYISKYETEIKRNKKLTPKAIKAIKILLDYYGELANENDENDLFLALSFAEEAQMKYILKENADFTFEEIENVFNSLKAYFINIEPRIIRASNKIEQQVGILEESLIVRN